MNTTYKMYIQTKWVQLPLCQLHFQWFSFQKGSWGLQHFVPVPRHHEHLHLHPFLVLLLPDLAQLHLLPQHAEVVAVQWSQLAVKRVTCLLKQKLLITATDNDTEQPIITCGNHRHHVSLKADRKREEPNIL